MNDLSSDTLLLRQDFNLNIFGLEGEDRKLDHIFSSYIS